MFYINSDGEIMDSIDGISQEASDEVLKLAYDIGVWVYGCFIYNNKPELTNLEPKAIRGMELRDLIRKLESMRNPWNRYPIENMLAMAPVDTKINIVHTDGLLKMIKVDVDRWKLYNDFFDGEENDSRMAGLCIERMGRLREVHVSYED